MRLCLLCLCLIPACAPFPQIEGVAAGQSANAAYPSLVPIETILAAAPAGSAPQTADLDGRLAALRTRAARLRSPVIDATTRARMAQGVTG